MITKTLNTSVVTLANGKVARFETVARSYKHGGSTTVDLHVKVTGHGVMIENVGNIVASGNVQGHTHTFQPSGKVTAMQPTNGTLAQAKAAAVAAAAFRMGTVAGEIAYRVNHDIAV